MTNHPNRSNLSYAAPAPVFADAEYMADIIGYARTAVEAVAIYRAYNEGTGETREARAVKTSRDRRNEGPVDGWAPEFVGE